jgi:hypothetical protein
MSFPNLKKLNLTQYEEMLKNPLLIGILAVISIVYTSYMTDKLPVQVAFVVGNPVMKLVLLFIILMFGNTNPLMAGIFVIFYMIALQLISMNVFFKQYPSLSFQEEDINVLGADVEGDVASMSSTMSSVGGDMMASETENILNGSHDDDFGEIGQKNDNPNQACPVAGGGDPSYANEQAINQLRNDIKNSLNELTGSAESKEHFADEDDDEEGFADEDDDEEGFTEYRYGTNYSENPPATNARNVRFDRSVVEHPDSPNHPVHNAESNIPAYNTNYENVDVDLKLLNPPYTVKNLPLHHGNAGYNMYEQTCAEDPEQVMKMPTPHADSRPALREEVKEGFMHSSTGCNNLPNQFNPVDPSMPCEENRHMTVGNSLHRNGKFSGPQGHQFPVGYPGSIVGARYGTLNAEL